MGPTTRSEPGTWGAVAVRSAERLARHQEAADVVGPLGQCQQLPGFPGKALLGRSRELGQVVVADQRRECLHEVTGLAEFLTLLCQTALVGLLKADALLLQPYEGIERRRGVIHSQPESPLTGPTELFATAETVGTVIFSSLLVATVLSLGVAPPFYLVIKGLEERCLLESTEPVAIPGDSSQA